MTSRRLHRPSRIASSLASFCFACFTTLGFAREPGARELTLEWILDPENLRPLQVARHLWLADGTLLLDDARKPPAERALERLDPRTLARRPAGEAKKLLEAWKAVLGEEKAPKALGLPSAAAADSRTLLYERAGDLFLADLAAGTLRRLTNTEAAEESDHRLEGTLRVVARAVPDGPDGVVCLLSALDSHTISTQIPAEVWVASERGARTPVLAHRPLRIVRFGGTAYDGGARPRGACLPRRKRPAPLSPSRNPWLENW